MLNIVAPPHLLSSPELDLTMKNTNNINTTYMFTNKNEHSTNKKVYGKLPLVSSKIKSRRMRMAGHCIRHPKLQYKI